MKHHFNNLLLLTTLPQQALILHRTHPSHLLDLLIQIFSGRRIQKFLIIIFKGKKEKFIFNRKLKILLKISYFSLPLIFIFQSFDTII